MSDLRLWPWRPRPQADELLSSWLRRIALGNSAKLHSFCHAVWPGCRSGIATSTGWRRLGSWRGWSRIPGSMRRSRS
ncbi:TniQ family protein [Aeromonas veronii]|uniref:TniQ family protein n=1 Tax=Aeromonas veronii TaxID=654 RepID=UPI00311CC27D